LFYLSFSEQLQKGGRMLFNLQILYDLAPITNVQLILDGIFIGAVISLSAYGLALVWGVMNVKNLAQGDFVILGGYMAFALFNAGVHPVVALPIVMVLMGMFGWMIYILIIRRVIQQDMFTSLLATFGLSLLLQQVLNLIFGPEVQTIDSKLPNFQLFDNSVTLPMVKILSLVMVAVLAIAVVIFMKKSRMGQAIRATAQDERAARVLGINTDNVYAFTFSLNAAICGAAGVMVSIIWVLQPFYGITYSLRSFAIVTAAGLGNLPGVITTGFGLGLLEQYTGFVLGAEYQVASAVVMLLLVLIYRQIQLSRKRQVVQ
jgi:branched-chain amino acid transport system permease protein